MAGGGADTPPPPPPPINGGEFLLQLLKNPPHHPHPQQPPPQQPLPHDPAVAAVGPSIPFSQSPFSSHRNLVFNPSSNLYFNQGLGFAQNPNPNLPNSNLGPNLNLDHPRLNLSASYGLGQRQISDQGVFDYMSKLGLIHTNHQQQQQQQQEADRKKAVYDMERRLLQERELGMQRNLPNVQNVQNVEVSSLTFGSYVSGEQNAVRRMGPPGFVSNAHSVGKGKGNDIEVAGLGERLRIGGRGLGERSRVDEGRVGLGGKADAEELRNGVDSGDLDELEEQVESLLLEDGTEDVKKGSKSRDKEYRSDKRGQWIMNQRMRNHKSHMVCRRDINRLNTHFLEIYESLIPPEEEKEKQKQLMALLNKHVTNEWPGARLFLYGSCANSFGFRKSDIDVCLALGDADVDKAEILLKLADILKSDNLENVQALTRARVPIVKLMDPVTGISCDICVNNLLAVINTKLLRDYSKIDVRLRQLAFIVKHWAKSRGVNETYQGTLSSYAYVLMCIHFLQQRTPSILPCLQGMETTYKVNVDNVECSYFDQVDKLQGFGSRNGESIAQLVWAFFNYWAYCHDYTNDVISIRMGCLISKREKDWTRRVGNDRHLICIEDPFECLTIWGGLWTNIAFGS